MKLNQSSVQCGQNDSKHQHVINSNVSNPITSAALFSLYTMTVNSIMLKVNEVGKSCDIIRTSKTVQSSREKNVRFATLKFDVLRSWMFWQILIFFLNRCTKNVTMKRHFTRIIKWAQFYCAYSDYLKFTAYVCLSVPLNVIFTVKCKHFDMCTLLKLRNIKTL
jgi:hypothetical protein